MKSRLAAFALALGLVVLLPCVSAQAKIVWERTYDAGKLESARRIVPSGDGGFLVAGYAGIPAGSTYISEGIYLLRVDADGNKVWDRKYVMDGTDRGFGNDAVETGDGGYVVVGTTRSFYTGDWALWLLKVDGDGQEVWERSYDRPGETVMAATIVPSGDGGFVMAGTARTRSISNTDIYLLKVDGEGGKVWEKSYGVEGRHEASGIVQSGDGGFVVAGKTEAFLPENRTTTHVYLLKIDGEGGKVWEKIHPITHGALSSSSAYRVIQAGDGGFMVTGNVDLRLLLLKTDSEGEIAWKMVREEGDGSKLSWKFDILRSCDGGFVLAGGSSRVIGSTYPSDLHIFKIGDFVDRTVHSVSYDLDPGGAGF